MIPYAGQYVPKRKTHAPPYSEPEWWHLAREMRGRGLSMGVIRRLLKRDPTSINYATNEVFRERKRAINRRRRQRVERSP